MRADLHRRVEQLETAMEAASPGVAVLLLAPGETDEAALGRAFPDGSAPGLIVYVQRFSEATP